MKETDSRTSKAIPRALLRYHSLIRRGFDCFTEVAAVLNVKGLWVSRSDEVLDLLQALRFGCGLEATDPFRGRQRDRCWIGAGKLLLSVSCIRIPVIVVANIRALHDISPRLPHFTVLLFYVRDRDTILRPAVDKIEELLLDTQGDFAQICVGDDLGQ